MRPIEHEAHDARPSVTADRTALHVLRVLVRLASRARRLTLEEVAAHVDVRRNDVRTALTALHREGYVDVIHMRPTLAGFTLGYAATGLRLSPLREASAAPKAPPSHAPPAPTRAA